MFRVLFLFLAAFLLLIGFKLFFFAMHLAFTALLLIATVTLVLGLGYFALRKS